MDLSIAKSFLKLVLNTFCQSLEDSRFFRFFLDHQEQSEKAETELIA